MMKMPAAAMPIANQVSLRTLSPRKTQPRSAVRSGEAASRKTALATVVIWMAKMMPPKAPTRLSPPRTPAIPTARIAASGRPELRQIRKPASTGSIPMERQKRIAHGPAASIWRKTSPCRDHSTPAIATMRTPTP